MSGEPALRTPAQPSHARSQRRYDVAIIGAGLAGLTAALTLQTAGRRVLVIERRSVAGGLCGTVRHDGFEFVLGCNDFGGGLVKILKALRVPVEFERVKHRFYFEGKTLQFPPDLATLMQGLGWTPDIVRLVRALRGQAYAESNLVSLVERETRSHTFAAFLYSLAYPIGLAPEHVSIATLGSAFSKSYGYELDKSHVPVGGPGRMIDEIVKAFRERGGTILFDRTGRVRTSNGGHVVDVGDMVCEADYVVSSEPRATAQSAAVGRGLSVSTLLLAVDRSFAYPAGLHTIAFFPADVPGWLRAVDRGQRPETLGFHMFANAFSTSDSGYTINVYMYLPRGMDDPEDRDVSEICDAVVNRIDSQYAGFRRAVRYRRFVSVRAYEDMHGLSSCVCPYPVAPATVKPDNFDKETGIYHVGNSVAPLGEHSGGAVLSGARVAERILAEMSRPEPRSDVSSSAARPSPASPSVGLKRSSASSFTEPRPAARRRRSLR